MEYKDLIDKVGMRFDIVEGELKESPSGLFLCSTTYQPYTIYLNKQTKQHSIIALSLWTLTMFGLSFLSKGDSVL